MNSVDEVRESSLRTMAAVLVELRSQGTVKDRLTAVRAATSLLEACGTKRTYVEHLYPLTPPPQGGPPSDE